MSYFMKVSLAVTYLVLCLPQLPSIKLIALALSWFTIGFTSLPINSQTNLLIALNDYYVVGQSNYFTLSGVFGEYSLLSATSVYD